MKKKTFFQRSNNFDEPEQNKQPAESITQKLVEFDDLLASITTGDKSGTIQVKDIAYFKKIRDRIQNYPVLQELYSKENKSLLRNRSANSFIPIKASVMHTRLSSAKQSVNSNFRNSQNTASVVNDQREEDFNDREQFNDLRHAQDLNMQISSKLNNLRICIMNSKNTISSVILKKAIQPLCNTLVGSHETAFMILDSKTCIGKVYAREDTHKFYINSAEFMKAATNTTCVNVTEAPFMEGIYFKKNYFTKSVELPGDESEDKKYLVLLLGSSDENINDNRKFSDFFRMMLNSDKNYNLNQIQGKLIVHIYNFIKIFDKEVEQPDYYMINKRIMKIQEAFYQNSYDIYNLTLKHLSKSSQNVQILTREDQKYDKLMESTDLYCQEDQDTYLVFKDYRIIFRFLNVNVQYLIMNPKLRDYLNRMMEYIKRNIDYISNSINLRDRESLKVNFEFDQEGTLLDQTTVFHAGLDNLIKRPMEMINMNLGKKITLIDLCREKGLLDKLNALVDNAALKSDGEITANMMGFDVLIRVKKGTFVDENARGFTLSIYRKTANTLPFLVAKHLEAQKHKTRHNEKYCISIPKGMTLPTAQKNVNSFQKDRFNVDEIPLQGLSTCNSNESDIIKENQDALSMSSHEYFYSSAKKLEHKKILDKALKKIKTLQSSKNTMIGSPRVDTNSQKVDESSPQKRIMSADTRIKEKKNTLHYNGGIKQQESIVLKKKYMQESTLETIKEFHDYVGDRHYKWMDDLIANPQFDVLHLVNNAEIFELVNRMFKYCQTTIKVNDVVFDKFIRKVERDYNKRNNPYHNFKHGVTVMQGMYYFCNYTSFSTVTNSLQKLSQIFAGLLHDIDHTGKSNSFETNSLSQLALTYNDKSVLENHHCATAFGILNDPETNLLKDLYENKTELTEFRKIVIHSILATDVKYHFDILSQFKTKLDNNTLCAIPDKNEDDFLLTCGILVHCADLYGPTKQLDNAKKWQSLVNAEFVGQLENEKRLGLPETPWYKGQDDMRVVAKGEKFFVEKLVIPLWIEVDRFLEGALVEQVENLESTIKYWTNLDKELNSKKDS